MRVSYAALGKSRLSLSNAERKNNSCNSNESVSDETALVDTRLVSEEGVEDEDVDGCKRISVFKKVIAFIGRDNILLTCSLLSTIA
jgi:hypothetical protein